MAREPFARMMMMVPVMMQLDVRGRDSMSGRKLEI